MDPMTPSAPVEEALSHLFATINRNAQERRRHHENAKLAALRRHPWWMDEPEPDNHDAETPVSSPMDASEPSKPLP